MVLTIAAVCSLLHDGGDEALVDLDPVERQAVDLGEARIAGSEIVERDADADILEAVDDRQDLVAVLEQRTFGDLDLEPVRRVAGSRQDLEDLFGQRGVAELHRRDIDRELQVRRPGARFLQRLFEDAERQRADQPGALGGLDEAFRFKQAAARRAPPGERLEADDLTAVQVHQRLEIRDELARLDAAADILLELQALANLALQRLVVPGEAVAAAALGGIERDVALAQRTLRRPCSH